MAAGAGRERGPADRAPEAHRRFALRNAVAFTQLGRWASRPAATRPKEPSRRARTRGDRPPTPRARPRTRSARAPDEARSRYPDGKAGSRLEAEASRSALEAP